MKTCAQSLIFALTLLVLPHLLNNAYADGNQSPAAQITLNAEQQNWLKQHPTVSYAPESDYGPFIYIEQDGPPMGLSVDFLTLLSQKTGLQFKATKAMQLSDSLAMAKRREVDVITSLRPTPERGEYLAFTSPYVSIPAILVVGATGSRDTRLDDMQGKRVAVGKGYAVEGFVREHFKRVEWVPVASDSEALKQLIDGKVDGLVADVASIHFITRQKDRSAIQLAARIGFEYPLSFAYRKDWTILGELLQKGLQASTQKEREQILQRWMPSDGADDWKSKANYLIIIALLLIAALAGLFIKSRSASRD